MEGKWTAIFFCALGKPKKKKSDLADVTSEEKSEFKRLDKIVKRGVEAFAEAGDALLRIHEESRRSVRF